MTLSLRVLGGFAIQDGAGGALPLPTRKARALMGYLAVNVDRPQPREKLTALLWSEHSDRQARHSLNQSLAAIRKLGKRSGTGLVSTNGDYVTLAGDGITIDLVRFRTLFDRDPSKAADLYEGPLLDGLPSPDPGFEEWLLPARAALHDQACSVLERATIEMARQNRPDLAVQLAKRLVALDPLREESHRILIRQLYEAGERASASRQYHACVDILRRELQVEPAPATRALLEEIKGTAGPSANSRHPAVASDTRSSGDRPFIAVLPFDSLGREAQAADLANGLVEDLITALSKLPQLRVVPRQFTTAYKVHETTIQQAANALGVRSVLTGSIRTSGPRMRCSVQLIDVAQQTQIWAESYDRLIDDVFAVSDDIIRQVLIELQVHLTAGESARVVSRGTRSLRAWLLYVQGYSEGLKFSRDGFARARALLEAAHRADPGWARPLAAIGWTHLHSAENGWSASREESIRLGIALTKQAIAMDPQEPLGYQALGRLHVLLGDHETGLALSEKAVSVAPNDHLAVAGLAIRYMWLEDFDRALDLFERARRICPLLPEQFLRRHGQALQLAGRLEEAVHLLEDLTTGSPEFVSGHVQLAAAYAEVGKLDSAKVSARTVLRLDPGFTISGFLNSQHFMKPSRFETLSGLLAKAGLPR